MISGWNLSKCVLCLWCRIHTPKFKHNCVNLESQLASCRGGLWQTTMSIEENLKSPNSNALNVPTTMKIESGNSNQWQSDSAKNSKRSDISLNNTLNIIRRSRCSVAPFTRQANSQIPYHVTIAQILPSASILYQAATPILPCVPI